MLDCEGMENHSFRNMTLVELMVVVHLCPKTSRSSRMDSLKDKAYKAKCNEVAVGPSNHVH